MSAYEFKNMLQETEVLEGDLPEGVTLFAEVEGKLKRVPKEKVGGTGGKVYYALSTTGVLRKYDGTEYDETKYGAGDVVTKEEFVKNYKNGTIMLFPPITPLAYPYGVPCIHYGLSDDFLVEYITYAGYNGHVIRNEVKFGA